MCLSSRVLEGIQDVTHIAQAKWFVTCRRMPKFCVHGFCQLLLVSRLDLGNLATPQT